MATLTAANNARIATAMNRRNLDAGDSIYSVAELMDSGRIAYVRENKAGKWGVILHDDIDGIENSAHDSLAEALYYTSFHEVAKMVAEALRADGIAAVRMVDGTPVIERVAL